MTAEDILREIVKKQEDIIEIYKQEISRKDAQIAIYEELVDKYEGLHEISNELLNLKDTNYLTILGVLRPDIAEEFKKIICFNVYKYIY